MHARWSGILLIPEGEYEVEYLHHETSSIFTRNDGGVRAGGKLYLRFRILPLYSDEINGKELFKSYNVARLIGKPGKYGKFTMTRGKQFVRDFERLIGKTKSLKRISPSAFRGRIYRVKVRTVKINQHHEEWCDASQYSVIDEIIEAVTGA